MKKGKGPVEEERYLDTKTSVLPKWFLEKGVICHLWDWYEKIEDMKRRLKFIEKEYNKELEFYKSLSKKIKNSKQRRYFNKKCVWDVRRLREQIKELKDAIKSKGIFYFRATDVEKLFRDTLKNDNKRK